MVMQLISEGGEKALYAQMRMHARRASNAEADARHRLRVNARRLDSLAQTAGVGESIVPEEFRARRDSRYAGSAGIGLARMFDQVYADVMRDDYPANNALEMIPIDRSISPGKKSHTVRRIDAQGKAKVHRGKADDVPTVSIAMDEESFPVLYYVTGVEYDIFEEMAANGANISLLDEQMGAARDIMLEFWNEKTWYGDEENGLYGILNYPYINKQVMDQTVVFENGGDATAMLSAMQSLVDIPGQVTKGKRVLRPTTVIVSVRMKQSMENTYVPNVGPGETVLSRLEASKGVRVMAAWEMQGSGPGGTDQVLVFRAGDRNSISNVAPIGFTTLPTQTQGFDYLIPAYMAHGGVIMRKPLSNIIGYANAR